MSAGELTLCEFNLENLFLSMEYYEGQDLDRMTEEEWREVALTQLRRRQKPIAKVRGVARAILDIDADVYMLTEVGGRESLDNLNRHFLGDRYEAFFIRGNSARAIDLGFLVRRGLPFEAEARSNRDTPIEVHSMELGRYEARFSRDVAELRLRDRDGPRLIVLLVHLKSKLTAEKDVEGKDVRTAEAIALAGMYGRLRADYPEVPIVLAGDFNAPLASTELELINRTDLADFHDVIGTPPDERVSLVYFDHAGRPRDQVLDYILVSPHLRGRINREKSRTYRYKGFHGIPDERPATWVEKFQMPSDHYPVVLTISF